MGREIERKYRVVGEAWRSLADGTLYRQGYLSREERRVVRVRTMGSVAVLTVKGRTTGVTRPEFEYEIPLDDANELLELCEKPIIEKTRYKIPLGPLVWEVDEFHGANDGLIVAECELEFEEQAIDTPDWVGEEVTTDPRFCNSNLVIHPFSDW